MNGARNHIVLMPPDLNWLLVFLLITCISVSCKTERKTNQEKDNIGDYQGHASELTPEQQAAFDALNQLQLSTDQMNRLYSTFPNTNQPCYPADTSFEISQSEFLISMERFIGKHCQNLSPEIQAQLAKSSVLAQKNYRVLHCAGFAANVDYNDGPPMTGIWVIPNVLNRRDIVLVW